MVWEIFDLMRYDLLCVNNLNSDIRKYFVTQIRMWQKKYCYLPLINCDDCEMNYMGKI